MLLNDPASAGFLATEPARWRLHNGAVSEGGFMQAWLDWLSGP